MTKLSMILGTIAFVASFGAKPSFAGDRAGDRITEFPRNIERLEPKAKSNPKELHEACDVSAEHDEEMCHAESHRESCDFEG